MLRNAQIFRNRTLMTPQTLAYSQPAPPPLPPLAGVIPVHLINLDRDTARLDAMSEQLDALGLAFSRIRAVDDAQQSSLLTRGEAGCYASHLIAMRRVAASGVPSLILEDDLEISADLPQILRRLDRLPRGWDFLKLSQLGGHRSFPIGEISPGRQIIDYHRVPWGAGAYVITPAGATRFLRWKVARTVPVDRDMRHVWKHGLRVYGIEPAPIRQNIGASSIGYIPAGRVFPRHDAPLEAVTRVLQDVRWFCRSILKGNPQ